MVTRKHRKSRKSTKRFRRTRSKRQRGGVGDENSDDDSVNECPICKEDLNSKPTSTTLCKHTFHTECIKHWCKSPQNAAEAGCPICRGSIKINCLQYLKNERLVDAIINEDFDATIETLICADIHNVDERHRTTPLFIACQIGSLETVKLLLSLGADVNARGYSGFTGDDVTPLIDAAYFNNYDVVKTLLENGADVNAQDEYGWTPLRYSFIEKEKDDVNLKVTELLLKQPNINLNLLELAPEDLDKPGKTALDWARELGWTEVAKLIQNHINHKNLRDARLVTVKGKKEDGTPLLSRAHRDVATLVAPFIGGKRKTRKSKKSKKSKRKTRK